MQSKARNMLWNKQSEFWMWSKSSEESEFLPAPVVVTTLALLRAPSPLVVYAATVTE